MNAGEVIAWHYLTRQPIRVTWRNGLIETVERCGPLLVADHCHSWIAPALFDVQVNGYGGVDFQQDDLSPDQLLHAVHSLRQDGCTRFFFTLISDEWPRMLTRLERARRLRADHSEIQQAIAGWHIEGPFLSDRPGFCGAHDPAVMLNPTDHHIHELRAAAGDEPLLLTIAPERTGAIRAIALAHSLGMIVSVGHTDASAEQLAQAAAAGATGFTHLANGCPRTLDRHDNIVWRVCDATSLTVSFIPDGIHVSPSPFRLLHRLLERRRIYYTSDAMSAAGAPPGRYCLGRHELEVGPDQIVRQPGQTNFAGSALRPIDGVRRASEMLNGSWSESWQRLSEASARFVGCPFDLAPGQPAHFCLVEVNDRQELISLRETIAGGQRFGTFQGNP